MALDDQARTQLIRGISHRLWEHAFRASGEPGRVPREPDAVRQAADDLMKLIEEANGSRLDRVLNYQDASIHELRVLGVELAALCLGESEAGMGVYNTGGLVIPGFEIRVSEDGTELIWDGLAEPKNEGPRRNPSGCACKHNPDAAPRILLLEDEPMIAKGTTRMLGRAFPGVPVTVVDNVDEAIAHLKHHDVTLVVSDYDVLGDKTGGDLFRWVQANKPELVEHYVFFSGNEAAVEALGHHRFLPKPAGLAEFKAAVLGGPTPNPAATPRDVSEAVLEVLPAILPEKDDDGKARERFGRKVFVSAIWRSINEDPRLHGIDEEEFKRLLLLAHRERLLSMARADYVAAMNADEVAESEIKADGATFHFVLDPSVER